MKAVGLRELKNRLSEYIRDVRRGENILITDRGEVVAELGPPGLHRIDSETAPGLVALARKGTATLGRANDPRVYPKLRQLLEPGRTTALLSEERGER